MTEAEPRGSGRVFAPAPPAGLEPLASPPSFSIMIPAYQAAETIGNAVKSALEQVHPAAEVIVVDDGSTDDILAALRPFEGDIVLIRKRNGGAASARNVGMKVARGEFVAVLDADDRFHPRRIEALAELASLRPDLDLITTDARFMVGGEEAGSFQRDNPFATQHQRLAILRNCFVGGWPAARAGRVREIGGFDESLRIGHDWDCWLRMILSGSGAGLVDRPYYDYVLHRGGLTASRVTALWDRVRLLEKAASNPSLRPEEHSTLKREIGRRRGDAVDEETQVALAGEGDLRHLPRLALLPGLAPRTRIAAALAAPAPALARRLVHSRRPPEERLSESER